MAASSEGQWRSAFFFLGRLLPAPFSRFNVQGAEPFLGTFFEAHWDGIAIWSRADGKEAHLRFPDAIRRVEDARTYFIQATAAYALLTGVALEATLDSWVELGDAEFTDKITGFRVDNPAFVPDPPPADERDSVALVAAAELAGALWRHPGYRNALADLHSALRDLSEDAYWRAYRAIESLAMQVAGRDDVDGDTWRALHQHLEVSESEFRSRIEPFARHRPQVAHGAQRTAPDPGERQDALLAARWVLAETLLRDGALTFVGEDQRERCLDQLELVGS